MRTSRAPAAYYGLLAICTVSYVLFRVFRASLAEGVVRNAFPSFLVPLFALAIIELTPGIRFHKRRYKIAAHVTVVVLIAIWLEVIVPLIVPWSVGEIWDAIAMGAGLLAFWTFSVAVSNVPARR